MDQNLRNRLRNVVTHCRRLLEDAVAQVLQGQFGIHATGKKEEVQVEDAARMGHLSKEDRQYREQILVHLHHIQATGFKPQEKPTKPALDQLIREIAFTHLNRLCAYKMMESRGLIREAVSRGLKSQGFLFYLAENDQDEKLHNTGHQDVAYRHFLNWLGGSLSEEIGVLFSPHDSANRLFPPQRVLEDVLEEINSEELKGIWTEDEAIGWVYQYFTPKELRDQARKESAAPRNSYELAFRNQFFTPRYVVEFLTDNTLGRIWYEMRKGDTALKDRCRYLVRRSNEVFLAEGEPPPASKVTNGAALSQQELLKQAVHIPHRPKKDPREIKVLDPACGSGHFLLYCFDLLLVVYEEAYADPDLRPALKKDYSTLDALRRALPGLILSRNLHGIDIDLRATQIAALALWLRAQRAYQDMGIKKNRPTIARSNIVCAEPMPGEKDLLECFLKTLREDKLEALVRRAMQVPADKRIRATTAMADRLCELVRLVWNKMKLAGEAGSLLRIEEELQEAIRKGQEEFEEKNPLFRVTEYSLNDEPTEHYYRFVPGDVEGQRVSFWDMAERLVLAALQDYAAYAANGNRLQRQLFVEDAVRGFGFVDLCRQRFDVALMNPPFGLPTKLAFEYLGEVSRITYVELYASFVERWQRRLVNGFLGAITSRAFTTMSKLAQWRQEGLIKKLCVLLDLGEGIMDDAWVLACAFILRSSPSDSNVLFLDLRSVADKPAHCTRTHWIGEATNVFAVPKSRLADMPEGKILYRLDQTFLDILRSAPAFEPTAGVVRQGLTTFDDFRFIRLFPEVDPRLIGRGVYWEWFSKGGEYARYFADAHLLVNRHNDGEELAEANRRLNGQTAQSRQSSAYYYRAGLTFTSRSEKGFAVKNLPADCVISHNAPSIFPKREEMLYFVLGWINSRLVRTFVELQTTNAFYVNGSVKSLPWVAPPPEIRTAISSATERLTVLYRSLGILHEDSPLFAGIPVASSVQDAWAQYFQTVEVTTQGIRALQANVSGRVDEVYGCDSSALAADIIGLTPDDDVPADILSLTDFAQGIWSWAIGCAFGRWDIRFALPDGNVVSLPEPFAPNPRCPPAALVHQDGLPTNRSPSEYPIRIAWDGIIPDQPSHPDDVVRLIHEVLELIWKNGADDIEKEACDILGVKELRDYFRKPGSGGFWDDHVKHYSKSRRKAPIYWLLQSSKKNYALWLYYHRLDKDILFKALVNYVEPKLRLEDDRLKALRAQRAGASGRDAKQLDRQIEKQDTFLAELRDFEEKLRRAANLHLDPDLNDGVVLNIAPLWELVPWKEAKAYWQELLAGEYEWSTIGKQLRQKGLVK